MIPLSKILKIFTWTENCIKVRVKDYAIKQGGAFLYIEDNEEETAVLLSPSYYKTINFGGKTKRRK